MSRTTGSGWTSIVMSTHVTCTNWCYQWAQELFGGVLRSFHGFWRHSLDILHHQSGLAFVPVHSDNFWKFELFLGLTQLITLKVAFWEEYMMEHLSVIVHWNWDEDTYMVGRLDTSFSDRRRRGSRFILFCIKKEYFNKREKCSMNKIIIK